MDFKFSKDSDDSQSQEASGEKKKQSALLILLLVLVGGFTYLYFFTGLIKPQVPTKTAEAPLATPAVVKIPLPARDGEATKPEVKTVGKLEVPKTAVPAPVAPVAPAAKPVAAKPATPPAPTPVKAKEEPKKTAVIKAADKKSLPAVVDKKEEKSAAESKKPATAVKKSALAKDSTKKQVLDSPAKNTVSKQQKTGTDSWSLFIGNYVLEEALSADLGHVRKAGFVPIVKPTARKKTTMNRLFVTEFGDRAAAQSAMDKMKRHTSDAFVIEHAGKFTVYAGSYLQSESARSEQERLKGAGIAVTIKNTEIAIPSQSLSIGPFSTKDAAQSALAKLKSSGITATLSPK
ncbi:MAG: SPOR domain-containing protein [Desulfuromonadales bacterium]